MLLLCQLTFHILHIYNLMRNAVQNITANPLIPFIFFQGVAVESEKTLHMVIQQQKEARGEVSCIATELLEDRKTEEPRLPPFMQES